MKSNRVINTMVSVLVMLVFANTAFAREILFQDPQHLAIVFRGEEKVDIGIPELVNAISDAGMGATIGGAVAGGMLGGLIAGAIVDHKYDPAAAEAGSPEQKQLDMVLSGWSFLELMRTNIMSSLLSLNPNIQAATIIPMNQAFPLTNREFYVNGKRDYKKHEPVYDYTALQNQGIRTVMEVTLFGYLTPNGNKKDVPSVFMQARMLDLPTKSVLEKKQVLSGGKKKGKATFVQLTQNNGALVKSSFEALSRDSTTTLAMKLKE